MRSKRRRFKVVQCLGQEFAVLTDSRFYSHAARKFKTEGAGKPRLVEGFENKKAARTFIKTWRNKGEVSAYALLSRGGETLRAIRPPSSANKTHDPDLSFRFTPEGEAQ
jgi:hypothetical protein